MVYSLYSVQDVCVGFGAVIMQPNDAAAMRAFAHECENTESYWHSHPADYSLWRVGSFDTVTGTVLDDTPTIVCRATDFVAGKE